jgi:hypothetical protein
VTTTSQVEPATEPTIQKEISGVVTTRPMGGALTLALLRQGSLTVRSLGAGE